MSHTAVAQQCTTHAIQPGPTPSVLVPAVGADGCAAMHRQLVQGQRGVTHRRAVLDLAQRVLAEVAVRVGEGRVAASVLGRIVVVVVVVKPPLILVDRIGRIGGRRGLR